MSAYRLNIASVSGLPDAAALLAALEPLAKHGLQADAQYGFTDVFGNAALVAALLYVRDWRDVGRVDDRGGIKAQRTEHIWRLPFVVWPGADRQGRAATTTGGRGTFGRLSEALIDLNVAPADRFCIMPLELDILSTVRKLAATKPRFQVRSAKFSDYFADEQTGGPFTGKFVDTAHGLEFMERYEKALIAASVTWRGSRGRVSLTVKNETCFAYSCDEDDAPAVKQLLDELAR